MRWWFQNNFSFWLYPLLNNIVDQQHLVAIPQSSEKERKHILMPLSKEKRRENLLSHNHIQSIKIGGKIWIQEISMLANHLWWISSWFFSFSLCLTAKRMHLRRRRREKLECINLKSKVIHMRNEPFGMKVKRQWLRMGKVRVERWMRLKLMKCNHAITKCNQQRWDDSSPQRDDGEW